MKPAPGDPYAGMFALWRYTCAGSPTTVMGGIVTRSQSENGAIRLYVRSVLGWVTPLMVTSPETGARLLARCKAREQRFRVEAAALLKQAEADIRAIVPELGDLP